MVEHVLHPQPGYPFSLAVGIEYALSDEGLAVATTATNIGPEPCPYGCGAHPYLTLGTPTVDTVVLTAPARTVLGSDDRGLPTGRTAVEGTEYDFTQSKADRRDAARPLLHRPRARRRRRPRRAARARRRGPHALARRAYGYLQLFTGDPLPDVARRSLAVEPMTCPPNAFRSGEDVVRLEPGESFTSAWGLTPGAA